VLAGNGESRRFQVLEASYSMDTTFDILYVGGQVAEMLHIRNAKDLEKNR